MFFAVQTANHHKAAFENGKQPTNFIIEQRAKRNGAERLCPYPAVRGKDRNDLVDAGFLAPDTPIDNKSFQLGATRRHRVQVAAANRYARLMHRLRIAGDKGMP